MDAKRIKIGGRRHYYDPEAKELFFAPSVTTVLSLVPDPGLEEWKEKVGKKKAKKFARRGANRGNVLHRMAEEYLVNRSLKDAQAFLRSEEGQEYTKRARKIGKSLFFKLYRLGWMDEIEEVIASEKMMLTRLAGGYAGTTDLVARLKNGKLVIIDFKSATRPKESVAKYQMQASGYWMMYSKEEGATADEAQIWVITENLECQRWIFDKDKLKKAGRMFLKYVKKYHDIYGKEIREFTEDNPELVGQTGGG